MLIVLPPTTKPAPAKPRKPSAAFHKVADNYFPALQQEVVTSMKAARTRVDKDALARAFEARNPTQIEALLGLHSFRLSERRHLRALILKIMQEKGDEAAKRLMKMRRYGQVVKDARDQIAKANEAAKQTGVMVALMLPSGAEQQLRSYASPEEKDNLHLTLAYLGKAADLTQAQVEWIPRIVKAVAAQQPPLEGVIQGVGRFNGSPSSDGKDVIWAHVDMPGLSEFRQKLVDELRREGLPVATNHGFTPHITLAYVDPDADLPLGATMKIPSIPFSVDRVYIKVGAHQEAAAFTILKGDVAGHEFHGNQWTGEHGTGVEGAIKEWDAKLPVNPFNDRESILNNRSLIEVKPFAGKLMIDAIRTVEGGKGHGSEALKTVLALADKYRVPTTLHAKAFGEKRMSNAKLMQWYKRYGFEKLRGNATDGYEMERPVGGVRKVTLDLTKGDVPGHEFHGNQWTDGGGAGQTEHGVPVAQVSDFRQLESAMGMHGQEGEKQYPERYEDRSGRGWLSLKHGAIQTRVGADANGKPILYDEKQGDLFKNRVPGSDRSLPSVFRVMSEEEFQNAAKNGYIKSDQRMNLAEEGTVASHGWTGTFYMQPGENRIVRIDVHPEDGWKVDPRDDYIKTPSKIPFDRVSMVSPKLLSKDRQGYDPTIVKGDVPGHPFHGNQYGSKGSIGDGKWEVTLPSGEKRSGTTKVPYTHAIVGHHWERPEWAVLGTAKSFPNAQKTVSTWQRNGWQKVHAVELHPTDLSKGDVPGHEFHGNQWTGGGAGLQPWKPGGTEPGSAANLEWTKAEIAAQKANPGTFQTPNVSSYLKAEVVKDIANRADLPFGRVNAMLASWAEHSSDHTADSVAMQIAAAKFAGDTPGKYLEALDKEVTANMPYIHEEADKAVRAMYESTQNWLSERGITELVLFRGAYFGATAGTREPPELKGVYGTPGGKEIRIGTSPLTSWSLGINVAHSFAYSGPDRSTPYLFSAKVPASHVMSLPFTGIGSLREKEVVVMGSRAHRIWATHLLNV